MRLRSRPDLSRLKHTPSACKHTRYDIGETTLPFEKTRETTGDTPQNQTLPHWNALNCFNRYRGAGIKVSASAVVIAILTSWTVLVRNREISPCEALIVLQPATVFMSPLSVPLFNPATVRFEGIGIFLGMTSIIWAINRIELLVCRNSL